MTMWGGRGAGVGWDPRLGGRRWVLPPTLCAAPCPQRGYDSIVSLAGMRAKPHPWGLGHERAAWGPVAEPGRAGQHPLGPRVAWLSLAVAVGAVRTKEQVGGPSQPSHRGHLHCGGLGLGELFVGEGLRMKCLPPATRAAPTTKEFVSRPVPTASCPQAPGHSRRHSWAASAVPRAHGRSWKKGRQRSQSAPVVLCWHRQTSWPVASGPHSLACPLHLHLGENQGGQGSGNKVGVPVGEGRVTREPLHSGEPSSVAQLRRSPEHLLCTRGRLWAPSPFNG